MFCRRFDDAALVPVPMHVEIFAGRGAHWFAREGMGVSYNALGHDARGHSARGRRGGLGAA